MKKGADFFFIKYSTKFLLNVVRQSINRYNGIIWISIQIILHLVNRSDCNDEIRWILETFKNDNRCLTVMKTAKQPFKSYYEFYCGYIDTIPYTDDLPEYVLTKLALKNADANMFTIALERGDVTAMYMRGLQKNLPELILRAAEQGSILAMMHLGKTDSLWNVRNWLFGYNFVPFNDKNTIITSDIGREVEGYEWYMPLVCQDSVQHYRTVSHSARRAALQSVILLTRQIGRDVARLIGKLIYSQRGGDGFT